MVASRLCIPVAEDLALDRESCWGDNPNCKLVGYNARGKLAFRSIFPRYPATCLEKCFSSCAFKLVIVWDGWDSFEGTSGVDYFVKTGLPVTPTPLSCCLYIVAVRSSYENSTYVEGTDKLVKFCFRVLNLQTGC